MPAGGEGELTVTVRMKVSPEPEGEQAVLDLMRRYRDALNYSVRAVLANKALSLGKAYRLLYKDLRKRYGLPSIIAAGCYKEAIAIAKSWLRNPKRGRGTNNKGPEYAAGARTGLQGQRRLCGADRRLQAQGNRMGQEVRRLP